MNTRIGAERQFLIESATRVAQGSTLTRAVHARVAELASRYDIDADRPIEQVLSGLLQRVDTLPISLVLVQAAKESGWGTSRFAVEGNSLFGQRCYEPGCGLAPKGRTAPSFSVQSFASVEDSVRSYVHNINTHPRYAELRRVRSAQRARGVPLHSVELAATLAPYSEQRLAYVRDVKAMIAQTETATHY